MTAKQSLISNFGTTSSPCRSLLLLHGFTNPIVYITQSMVCCVQMFIINCFQFNDSCCSALKIIGRTPSDRLVLCRTSAYKHSPPVGSAQGRCSQTRRKASMNLWCDVMDITATSRPFVLKPLIESVPDIHCSSSLSNIISSIFLARISISSNVSRSSGLHTSSSSVNPGSNG